MLIFQSNPHSESRSSVAHVGHGLHVSTHMVYVQGCIYYIYSYLEKRKKNKHLSQLVFVKT